MCDFVFTCTFGALIKSPKFHTVEREKKIAHRVLRHHSKLIV